jgi:hypothetical protein
MGAFVEREICANRDNPRTLHYPLANYSRKLADYSSLDSGQLLQANGSGQACRASAYNDNIVFH